jgi:transposase
MCGKCGRETKVIGYEETEVLGMKPAMHFVRVIKREKRACKSCAEHGVVTAPAPVRIAPKSIFADETIIDFIVRKYCEALPLYRQRAILLRDRGIDVALTCCWSHARRGFTDAIRVQTKAHATDAKLERAVALMDGLFAIDREAREQNLSLDDRHALRQERAPALLDDAVRDASLEHDPAAVGGGQGDQLHAEALGRTDAVPRPSHRRVIDKLG